MSLSQSQRLQMTLAPQLRQSLEMLQLPVLELRALIQQELEKNPTLEETPLEQQSVEVETKPGDAADNDEMNFDKEFEALAKLDDEWRDYFFEDAQSRPYTSEDAERRQYMFDSIPQKESLQEHLLSQLHLAGLSQEELQVGELLIGSINEDGYLTTPLAELAANSNTSAGCLEDLLHVIQEFHPTGVGARDLSECLLIQLERQDKPSPLAVEIVRNHLERLGAHKYPDIARDLNATVEDVQQAAKIVAGLNPKPGNLYTDEEATFILPEVIVRKFEGEYVVILNDDQLPHLKISDHYRQLMKDKSTTPEVKSYLRDQIKSSVFMIKSIEQRQRTIYRIAMEIVRHQRDFLEKGLSCLKPMTMAEVAAAVGVHETTVSRTVANKYMKTPIGIFEMKYFFTPGLKTADGTEISNKTVKNIIANLVAEENPAHPLSDQDVMEHLKQRGIHIARRTIAKYRLVLRIPSSHMRKNM